MRSKKQKELIIEIGRRLWQRGMVAANDGNISCRLKNGILITASGVSKGFLAKDDILLLDNSGQMIENKTAKPSVETRMHLAVYANCPKAQAIVHAHPPYATAFSLSEENINDCPLEEIKIQLGQVPRLVYAPAGSKELADNVGIGMKDARVGLMLRHGAIAIGNDLLQAYHRIEALEQAAKIAIIAKTI